MKLKDRPLNWWKGRSYRYWCGADVNDTRKINYTVIHRSIGQGEREYHFTSDDQVGVDKLYWLQTGCIKDLKLVKDEWHVVIVAGIVLKEDFA